MQNYGHTSDDIFKQMCVRIPSSSTSVLWMVLYIYIYCDWLLLIKHSIRCNKQKIQDYQIQKKKKKKKEKKKKKKNPNLARKTKEKKKQKKKKKKNKKKKKTKKKKQKEQRKAKK
eukprot:TRINITY_DN12026_c1_g1_i1.p9 TRINITY_DN12026_c1_g1~~TRINITY_DN12026_c1_g1_i1.p9  ORF type:complete len:115 (+),score=26.92 TRINITY_DN12026_c1_g1_i1:1406-1750(+)